MEKETSELKCIQCQNEMVKDCIVQVEGVKYGLKIIKKLKGLFNKTSEKPKASVCPNCGYVALYIENFRDFS